MGYIHLFQTVNEFNSAFTNNYVEPWVSYTKESSAVTYNKPDPFNGHAYVDLDLPSGTLWATCNVGATSPEEYGSFFAWGEIFEKSAYSWSNYRFGENSGSLTKYNATDGKITLDLDDDAVATNWGGEWRMPTRAECEELISTANTTSAWTTVNGINGIQLTSKANGNAIFFPAAGYNDVSVVDRGNGAHVWSSTHGDETPFSDELYGMSFRVRLTSNDRYLGYSVRGVVGVSS